MSLKPFEAGGQLYDKAALEDHRVLMIALRDAALEQGNMTYSVFLSHNVAILAHIIKEMDDA